MDQIRVYEVCKSLHSVLCFSFPRCFTIKVHSVWHSSANLLQIKETYKKITHWQCMIMSVLNFNIKKRILCIYCVTSHVKYLSLFFFCLGLFQRSDTAPQFLPGAPWFPWSPKHLQWPPLWLPALGTLWHSGSPKITLTLASARHLSQSTHQRGHGTKHGVCTLCFLTW